MDISPERSEKDVERGNAEPPVDEACLNIRAVEVSVLPVFYFFEQ